MSKRYKQKFNSMHASGLGRELDIQCQSIEWNTALQEPIIEAIVFYKGADRKIFFTEQCLLEWPDEVDYFLNEGIIEQLEAARRAIQEVRKSLGMELATDPVESFEGGYEYGSNRQRIVRRLLNTYRPLHLIQDGPSVK
ncbi:hypothetical protein N9Z27_02975 [Alphaproteobacteria bacterium]|nr:hypothetical protein [Alphaproteobacteria bacterium]